MKIKFLSTIQKKKNFLISPFGYLSNVSQGGQKVRTVIIFLLLISNLFSQVEEGRRITQELCSQKYFGRGYIKNGDSLAAEFLASEFEKRGLKKIKKSYFQNFSFNVNTFPSDMQIKINGKTIIPGVDYIVDPSSGSSNLAWKYTYIEKGELLNDKTLGEIVAEIESKKINSLVIDTRSLKGDSLKKVKGLQQSLALLCPIISITDEKFTFSVSDEQLPFSLIYMHGNAFENEAKIESKISAVLKKNHQARNVLASIKAEKRSKKTIFITAHYDHLGGMGSETYFPGGNDNASGTSMLFALADEFKKNPLKNYNLVFIAFAGEESGLLGSKYYVEHPLIKAKNLKFVLNLDIMGSGEEGITVVNATEFPELFARLNAVNEEQKLLSLIKKRGKAANSDHYWFSENGFPAFFIYTMGPNKNYHDVFDTYEALSFNEYNDLVKLVSGFLKRF